MKLVALISASLLSSISTIAFAQEASPAAAPIATQQPQSAAPAAPAPSVTSGGCSLGDHAGIADADAATATKIVCSELTNAGARADETHRVELARLGESVILTVSRGTTSRTVRLARIEEVPTAAPRVAESLVHGTSLESTEKVDNLVGEEARQYAKRPGEFRFGLGVLGMQMLGASASIDTGLVAQAMYEAPRFAVGLDIRGAWAPSHSQDSAAYFAIGPTARYFLSEGDVTPYVGGGLAFTALSLTPSGQPMANGNGLAPFAEIGVEALRTHRARVMVGLRVDLPLYSLEGESNAFDSSGGIRLVPSSAAGYHAPTSLNVSVAW
jgi:hypothetical protein